MIEISFSIRDALIHAKDIGLLVCPWQDKGEVNVSGNVPGNDVGRLALFGRRLFGRSLLGRGCLL